MYVLCIYYYLSFSTILLYILFVVGFRPFKTRNLGGWWSVFDPSLLKSVGLRPKYGVRYPNSCCLHPSFGVLMPNFSQRTGVLYLDKPSFQH